MRALSITAILLVTLSAAATALAKTPDPRAEKERLNPADMALAKAIVLRRADLPAGWKAAPTPPDDDEPFTCPGFEPDFSAFTLTGKAEAAFSHAKGSSLLVFAEVYPSRKHAAGDFQTGAKPAVARCLKVLLEEELEKGQTQNLAMTVSSSKMVPAPRLGERAAAYKLVVDVEASGQKAKIYLDLLVIQKGRSLAAMMAIGVLKAVPGQSQLAAKMVSRMR